MSTSPLALVVEDDFDAATIFAKALEAVGFSTEVIREGDTALKRLEEIVPHLVLLDLHLPNVGGKEILTNIRADARLAHTRVIIASADPRTADTLQDIADLVLIKPISFSQVRDLTARFKPST
jgi:DNA-binding response OmpR family regulator